MPNKYVSPDAITYYRSVFMKAGIWLFNTTVQYHMHGVNAYIKLDLNPYDVTLEWMEFDLRIYITNGIYVTWRLYSQRLRHTVLIKSSNPSLWTIIDDWWWFRKQNWPKDGYLYFGMWKTFPRHTEDMDHYDINEVFSSPLSSHLTNGLHPWGQSQIASTIFAYDSIIMIYGFHVPLTECDLLRTFKTMNDIIEISVVNSMTRIVRDSAFSSTRRMWPRYI